MCGFDRCLDGRFALRAQIDAKTAVAQTRLLRSMGAAHTKVIGRSSDDELELIADYLERVAEL